MYILNFASYKLCVAYDLLIPENYPSDSKKYVEILISINVLIYKHTQGHQIDFQIDFHTIIDQKNDRLRVWSLYIKLAWHEQTVLSNMHRTVYEEHVP